MKNQRVLYSNFSEPMHAAAFLGGAIGSKYERSDPAEKIVSIATFQLILNSRGGYDLIVVVNTETEDPPCPGCVAGEPVSPAHSRLHRYHRRAGNQLRSR